MAGDLSPAQSSSPTRPPGNQPSAAGPEVSQRVIRRKIDPRRWPTCGHPSPGGGTAQPVCRPAPASVRLRVGRAPGRRPRCCRPPSGSAAPAGLARRRHHRLATGRLLTYLEAALALHGRRDRRHGRHPPSRRTCRTPRSRACSPSRSARHRVLVVLDDAERLADAPDSAGRAGVVRPLPAGVGPAADAQPGRAAVPRPRWARAVGRGGRRGGPRAHGAGGRRRAGRHWPHRHRSGGRGRSRPAAG